MERPKFEGLSFPLSHKVGGSVPVRKRRVSCSLPFAPTSIMEIPLQPLNYIWSLLIIPLLPVQIVYIICITSHHIKAMWQSLSFWSKIMIQINNPNHHIRFLQSQPNILPFFFYLYPPFLIQPNRPTFTAIRFQYRQDHECLLFDVSNICQPPISLLLNCLYQKNRNHLHCQ